MNAISLSWLIPVLPLCSGILLNSAIARHLPRFITKVIAVTSILISTLLTLACAIVIVVHRNDASYFVQPFGQWMMVSQIAIPITFLLDTLSVNALLLISLMSLFIHVFISSLCKTEQSESYLLGTLNLLHAFTAIYLLGGSILVSYTGWTAMSVAMLFLQLVIRPSDESSVDNPGVISFLITESIALTGILILFSEYRSLEYEHFLRFSSMRPDIPIPVSTIIGTVCLSVGIAMKMALVPFFHWLPSSNSLPIAARIFIHGIITPSGIYFLLRNDILIGHIRFLTASMLIIGIVTTLFSIFFAANIKNLRLSYPFISMGVSGMLVITLSLSDYQTALLAWMLSIIPLTLILSSIGLMLRRQELAGLHDMNESSVHSTNVMEFQNSGLKMEHIVVSLAAVLTIISIGIAYCLFILDMPSIHFLLQPVWSSFSESSLPGLKRFALFTFNLLMLWLLSISVRFSRRKLHTHIYFYWLQWIAVHYAWIDIFFQYAFVKPFRQLGYGIWRFETWLITVLSDGIPWVIRKWGLVTGLFDQWCIHGMFEQGLKVILYGIGRTGLFFISSDHARYTAIITSVLLVFSMLILLL